MGVFPTCTSTKQRESYTVRSTVNTILTRARVLKAAALGISYLTARQGENLNYSKIEADAKINSFEHNDASYGVIIGEDFKILILTDLMTMMMRILSG